MHVNALVSDILLKLAPLSITSKYKKAIMWYDKQAFWLSEGHLVQVDHYIHALIYEK